MGKTLCVTGCHRVALLGGSYVVYDITVEWEPVVFQSDSQSEVEEWLSLQESWEQYVEEQEAVVA